jgi:hypothetical protein
MYSRQNLLNYSLSFLHVGELLFVPAGSPHYVENLDQTLAISSNYVDLSNLPLVRGELAVDGLINDRADNVMEQMNSDSFQSTMNGDIQDMAWKDFKQWPKAYSLYKV